MYAIAMNRRLSQLRHILPSAKPLTTLQLAKLLQVSPSTIARMVRDDPDLPSFKYDNRRLFSPYAVIEYLRSRS